MGYPTATIEHNFARPTLGLDYSTRLGRAPVRSDCIVFHAVRKAANLQNVLHDRLSHRGAYLVRLGPYTAGSGSLLP